MKGLKKGILVKNGVAVGAVGDKYFSSTAIGVIQAFSGTTIPHGYLLADGASYKVADYPDLYAVIGNTYGGDTENFNVPNLVDKFIEGSTTSGEEKEAGLPNITGSFVPWAYQNSLSPSGAFSQSYTNVSAYDAYGANKGSQINFNASQSNSIYGNSDTVQPPALTMVYIIKAFHTNEGVDSGVSDDVIEYVETELNAKLSEKANKADETKLFLKSLADGVNSFYSESENDEACLYDRKCKRTSSEPCVWFRLVMGTDPYEGWLCIGLTENSVKCNPLTEYGGTNYSNFTENGITFYVGFMSNRYPTSQNYEFYITIDGKKYVPANRVYTVSTDRVPSLSVLNTWYNWQKICTTSVADVGKTAITITDTTNYKNQDSDASFSHYYVQNGICYMSMWIACVTPYTSSATKTCTSAVPKPKYYVRKIVPAWETTNSNSNYIEFCINGTSAFIAGGTTGKTYLLQFSYPVAES